MDAPESTEALADLVAGFETLGTEYVKLFKHYQTLERTLLGVRAQYDELAKLFAKDALPPHSSNLGRSTLDGDDTTLTAHECISWNKTEGAREAARVVRAGFEARKILSRRADTASSSAGVKIWAGPAAEVCVVPGSNLPSISESPLEQDFTVQGKPSQLGCPFASMANKKLSSHAASVLSRYNTRDSTGRSSTPPSSVSRVNGRESYARRESRRTSFVDPIKAEICGMSDHGEGSKREEPTVDEPVIKAADAVDIGICPIRFLDQHSPEEVATYFEKHKHELPRSHEVCVRRYQSNEAQIRELDAKYGNLVSMIQGLGQKHKGMLPDEPDAEDEDDEGVDEDVVVDAASNEKVRGWANSVLLEPTEGSEQVDMAAVENDGERQSHFDRPLREIRVGESPSRPWGISVPAKYLEEHASHDIQTDPPKSADPVVDIETHAHVERRDENTRPAGRCPFGFDQIPPPPQQDTETKASPVPNPEEKRIENNEPVFLKNDGHLLNPESQKVHEKTPAESSTVSPPQMIFSGPVFIGYSVEDAAKILRAAGSR